MKIFYEDLKVELPYAEKVIDSFITASGDPLELPTKEFEVDYTYIVEDERAIKFLRTIKENATLEDAKEFKEELQEHFEDEAREKLEWEAPIQYLD